MNNPPGDKKEDWNLPTPRDNSPNQKNNHWDGRLYLRIRNMNRRVSLTTFFPHLIPRERLIGDEQREAYLNLGVGSINWTNTHFPALFGMREFLEGPMVLNMGPLQGWKSNWRTGEVNPSTRTLIIPARGQNRPNPTTFRQAIWAYLHPFPREMLREVYVYTSFPAREQRFEWRNMEVLLEFERRAREISDIRDQMAWIPADESEDESEGSEENSEVIPFDYFYIPRNSQENLEVLTEENLEEVQNLMILEDLIQRAERSRDELEENLKESFEKSKSRD